MSLIKLLLIFALWVPTFLIKKKLWGGKCYDCVSANEFCVEK